jgi:hypothetical protein
MSVGDAPELPFFTLSIGAEADRWTQPGLHPPSRHPALTEPPGVVRACRERTEPEHITSAPNDSAAIAPTAPDRHLRDNVKVRPAVASAMSVACSSESGRRSRRSVGCLRFDPAVVPPDPVPRHAISVCLGRRCGCWVEAYFGLTSERSARDTTRPGQTRAVTRDHERCDACGFDGALYTDAALLEALRSLHVRWRQQLGAAGSELRIRPEPNTWSAIEYAAHSRDITALHVYGVEQALMQDEPIFPPIGDDLVEAAAVAYADSNPGEVVEALGVAAERLARLADDAGVDAWTRGLTVGESRSDVRRLLEHALHDSQHHLTDVERGLASLRAG